MAAEDVEFGHGGGEVVAHGSGGEVELLGDALDGVAGACGTQDVEFAASEGAVGFGQRGCGDVGVDVAVAVGDVAQDVGELAGRGGLGDEPGDAGGQGAAQYAGAGVAGDQRDAGG